MKPARARTLLDTVAPESATERHQRSEQDSDAWVRRIRATLSLTQQTQMARLLAHKRGGQIKWTPEAVATLAEQARQMRLAHVTPKRIHQRLATQYGCDAKTIANRLSEIRRK